MFDGMMPDPKPTDVPESTNCKHDLTISVIVDGQSDMRECVDCRTTFSGRELATERMRQNLDEVAKDVAGWPETKRANAEAIMYPENRLNPPLASPVAGGSARIAEIAARLAAITPGPWEMEGPYRLYQAPTVWQIWNKFSSYWIAWVQRADHLPEQSEANARFIAAAPEDIAFLLKLVPEGWVKVTPETMPPTGKEYWVWGPAFRHPKKDLLIYGGNGPEWQYFANSAVTHFQPVICPAPPVEIGNQRAEREGI